MFAVQCEFSFLVFEFDSSFHPPPRDDTLNQLRYDLRKLRLHGLIERVPKSYAYRFTDKGTKLSILLLQLRKRLYGPWVLPCSEGRPIQTSSLTPGLKRPT